VHPKVDQTGGQLSLPHATNNYSQKKTKTKTDEQINPVTNLEP